MGEVIQMTDFDGEFDLGVVHRLQKGSRSRMILVVCTVYRNGGKGELCSMHIRRGWITTLRQSSAESLRLLCS